MGAGDPVLQRTITVALDDILLLDNSWIKRVDKDYRATSLLRLCGPAHKLLYLLPAMVEALNEPGW